MKYDFTSIIDRIGKDAMAVDLPATDPKYNIKEGYDIIPMWVADMNFATAPSIIECVQKRLEHPAYGYFGPRDEYYDSIIRWHEKRNGVQGMEKKHIGYENGVLGGVISAMNVLCSKGDNVLVHSPTYIGFTFSLEDNGYHIIHSPLYKDENGIWRMDYEDMEKKIVDNNIHTAIFCSPHNPTGRVWEKEEIEKAMEIYEKHQVWVISDEIWSDLLMNGNRHIPTQSVNAYAHDHTAAYYAPSKTFNLAGFIGSYHVIYNDWLRDRVRKESRNTHYNSMNVLSMYALIGGYSETGSEWVDEVIEVLSGNINYACDYIEKHFEGVSVSKPEGTYMLFIDCEDWCKANHTSLDDLIQKGWNYGVIWQDGRPFHGEYSIRLNLALPLSRVQEAFRRLDEFVFHQ